jgi:hypothetical protein
MSMRDHLAAQVGFDEVAELIGFVERHSERVDNEKRLVASRSGSITPKRLRFQVPKTTQQQPVASSAGAVQLLAAGVGALAASKSSRLSGAVLRRERLLPGFSVEKQFSLVVALHRGRCAY